MLLTANNNSNVYCTRLTTMITTIIYYNVIFRFLRPIPGKTRVPHIRKPGITRTRTLASKKDDRNPFVTDDDDGSLRDRVPERFPETPDLLIDCENVRGEYYGDHKSFTMYSVVLYVIAFYNIAKLNVLNYPEKTDEIK